MSTNLFGSFEKRILLAAFGFFCIRLLFIGQIYLLPEEAYYWKYAEHLDIGYLDHPPMVALSIFLGQLLFGVNEFALRISASVWSLFGTFFVYLFVKDISSRKNACVAVLLFQSLPYFFATGFFITPDSPLTAFSAALLFSVYRILIQKRYEYWPLFGIFMGCGMLSKYPVVLLGLPLLLMLLLDKEHRKAFIDYRLYLGAFLSILIFSPVLVWNYEHDFVSFLFQSAGRIEKSSKFYTPEFLLYILILLSPIGFYVFVKNIFAKTEDIFFSEISLDKKRFIKFFTLIPLLVFLLVSVTKEVKINWAGPIFISFLPVLAASFDESNVKFFKAWKITLYILALIYIVTFLYIGAFLKVIPYSDKMYKIMTGDELGRAILNLEERYLKEKGIRPIVVGMDKHYLASQIGFYRKKLQGDIRLEETEGRSPFGLESLMYRYWTKKEDLENHPLLLVSRSSSDLKDEISNEHAEGLSKIEELKVEKNGYIVARFYYRFVENFH